MRRKEEGSLELRVGKAVLRLVQGDITEQETEAIVNAANPSLMGGGGVDGAIHRKGGPTIREECARIREREWPDGLPVGEAVITSGGRLKARYVIHTVGPIWRGGNKREPQMLARAYRSCLQLAVSRGIRRLSFPSISTGAYGYPVEKASRVALRTVKEFLEKEDRLEEVRFVLFTEGDLKVYEEAARELFPG